MITFNKIAGDGAVIVIDGASIESFKTLVHRATNLWPNAPPEIKEFADLVTNGSVLQDYRRQDTSSPATESSEGAFPAFPTIPSIRK